MLGSRFWVQGHYHNLVLTCTHVHMQELTLFPYDVMVGKVGTNMHVLYLKTCMFSCIFSAYVSPHNIIGEKGLLACTESYNSVIAELAISFPLLPPGCSSIMGPVPLYRTATVASSAALPSLGRSSSLRPTGRRDCGGFWQRWRVACPSGSFRRYGRCVCVCVCVCV